MVYFETSLFVVDQRISIQECEWTLYALSSSKRDFDLRSDTLFSAHSASNRTDSDWARTQTLIVRERVFSD